MKPLVLTTACGLVLAAAACAPSGPPTARAALDCPSEQGDLKLNNETPDKKTCTYVSRSGDEVQLRLIPVSSSYEAALQPIEQELQGEVETAPAATAEPKADEKPGQKAANATSSGADAAARAAQQANQDAHDDQKDDDDKDGKEEKETLSLGPAGGITASSGAKGDHANIDLPGIHISADDDKANVSMGSTHIDAGEDGATVRVARDVRLRGEAFSRQRRGFRATYILAKDNLKDGLTAVGYEAAGPKTGPITVAVFKARGGHRHGVSEDVRRLVRHNGGI